MPTRVLSEGRMVIHAALLAGGRSRRMGTDKRFLRVNGEFVIDRMIRLTKSWASGSQGRMFLLGSVDGYESLPDRVGGLGPLGGLHSVVSLLRDEFPPDDTFVLLLPVDMPKLTPALFDRLAEAAKKRPLPPVFDAVRFEGFELPCLFHVTPRLQKEISRVLNEREASARSLRNLFRTLESTEIRLESGFLDCMENVNTPDDWARVRKTL